MKMKGTAALSVLLLLVLSGPAAVSAKPAADKNTAPGSGPVVSGPVKGGERGYPFNAYFGDMRNIGYVEEEFFLQGNAVRYEPVDELKVDGLWNIEPVSNAPFKTRFLVRRPADPAKFNGTVIVEWANVSAGYEISMSDSPGLYTNGFAYVVVSAQPTGINGFPSKPRGLKVWDSERYGSLSIPDEALSFDIFTQAAQAVSPDRKNLTRGADPMGGLTVKKLIGVGGSQSGSRLLAYTNGVQPLSKIFDALIPALNAGTGSDFSTEMGHPDSGSGDTSHSKSIRSRVREDLAIPVLAFNTQTEALFYSFQRQSDTAKFRSWEIAGSSHMPKRYNTFMRPKMERDGMADSLNVRTTTRISEVDWFNVLDAAFVHVHRWITDGTPPPQAEPIQMAGRDYAYDANGNVLGGIRLPEITVPYAKFVAGPSYALGGFTVPFTPAKLKQLYPTHDEYVAKVTAAANAVKDAGFILAPAVDWYTGEAKAAPIPEEIIIEPQNSIRATPEARTTR